VNHSSGDSIGRSGTSLNEAGLRKELLALIESWDLRLPPTIGDNTPLISSGVFDSLALFNLTIWIEEKIGRSIDPSRVNIAAEWDSVRGVLQFVQRNSSGAPPSSVVKMPIPLGPLGDDDKYRIVRYEPKHKSAVTELQTRLWSPDSARNVRYLEWKYERNPYRKGTVIYLAFHGKDLVGMRGFYGSRWETGIPARQFDILVADDLVVHEDHRNAGVTTRIMQAAYEDLRRSGEKFLFNLSGGPLTVVGSLATGWRSCGTVDPFRRVSSTAKRYTAVRTVASRVPFLRRYVSLPIFHGTAELEPFSRLDRNASRVETDVGPIAIEKSPRPKAMAQLIERIGHDGRIRHVRDQAFFDWRFQNPLHEYRFLFAGNETLDGYLVLKTSANRSDRRVGIVDLEANNEHIQAELLRAAVTAGCFADMFIWTAAASGALLKELRALQFQPLIDNRSAIERACFLVRALEKDQPPENWRLGESGLLHIKNWDIRMIQTMAG
jgi:GNAT superfamily N-acetyltransferase/acyl carrier protein